MAVGRITDSYFLYLKIGPLLWHVSLFIFRQGKNASDYLPVQQRPALGGRQRGQYTAESVLSGCVLWMSIDACKFKWAWLRGGGGALKSGTALAVAVNRTQFPP